MTIQELLAEGRRLLSLPCEDAFIDTPSLDAGLLLAEVLQTHRETLITRCNETIAVKSREKFIKLIERRRAGECVAYILGRKEFRGLDFNVNHSVLVPRPDTEILAEAALEYIDLLRISKSAVSVLDLCTGSGALAIALKNERPFISITATDISNEALKTAKSNAEKLGQKIKFIQSDLFENIPGKFGIIVSNPPYVPSGKLAFLTPEVKLEPAIALDGGKDGLDLVKKIIFKAPDYLKPEGVLLLETGSEQITQITEILKRRDFRDIKVFKDLSGGDRVTAATI